MRKINGVPVEAHTDLSSLTGGEVLKWDSTNTLMAWEDQDSTGFVPFHGVGSNYGFGAGGADGSGTRSDIYRFAFASNTTASDWGDLTAGKERTDGNSSSTDGFATGGYNNGTNTNVNTIEKFSFTSSAGAADHGDLVIYKKITATSSSTTHGFSAGGDGHTTSGNYYNVQNNIEKFAFSSNTTAADHGDISVARGSMAGITSTDKGFAAGQGRSGYGNTIDKFDFASNTTATDHGDLDANRGYNSGHQSSTDGFTTGGKESGGHMNVISKFSFSSNTTAADHGDLTIVNYSVDPTSATDYGYASGGAYNDTAWVSNIDKFAFSSNTTAAGHGDLDATRGAGAGSQY